MATYSGIHDLPLVAGHPALDLVNTVEPRLPLVTAEDQVHDRLAAPTDLLVWAQRAGLVNEAELAAETKAWGDHPDRAKRSLAEVRAGREALYAVLIGTEGNSLESSLDLLSAQWVAAAGRTRLRPATGGTSRFVSAVGTESGLMVLDRVATVTHDLLTAVDLTSLRACPLEEGGCGWLFVDRSRGRTRRWCVMADCGAKAKSRRLTDRRRAARSS